MLKLQTGYQLQPDEININDQFKFIDEIADAYSEDRWNQKALILKELELVFSFMKENSFCLELGAGSGVVTQLLNESGYNTVGLEQSENMIKHAQVKGVHSLIRGDGFNLPIADKTFDAVFSWGNTLGPIPGEKNRSKMLSEARRVLKPDGILAISVLNKGCNLRRSIGPHEYTFHYKSKSSAWKSELAGYNKFYSIGEIKKQLQLAGFRRFRRLTSRCDLAIVLIADGYSS